LQPGYWSTYSYYHNDYRYKLKMESAMRYVILGLASLAVMASPCAWDTDPRESAEFLKTVAASQSQMRTPVAQMPSGITDVAAGAPAPRT
jgi:hypothetical protein